MQSTTSSTPRKLGIGRILGLGLLAILTVLLLWNVLWRVSNNRAVARLEAAARQRGEPVTIRDLALLYGEVPDEENIHRAMIEVWASDDPTYWNAYKNGIRPLPLMQSEKYDPDLPILGSNSRFHYTNDLNALELASIRRFLSTNKIHIAAVNAALRLKAYRANYDFDQAYAMLMPELAKLKREAQFFQLEALDAIEAKNNTRAIGAIADMTRVGSCLKTDPTLIGQLVRIACYNLAVSTTERLLKQRQLTEAEIRLLEPILDEMKLDNGMQRAFASERAFAWAVFDAPAKQLASLTSSDSEGGSSPGAAAVGFRLMRLVGMTGAEKRLMAETYEQAIRCLNKPDYATTDELHGIFETMTGKARRFPPKVLTMMLMPALEKAGEKAARFEALRRCAVTALAVERYRQTHQGSLPAHLNELDPVPLDDPFTGEPLLLKRTPGGYVVYSVGPDRKDDDAQLDAPKSSLQNRAPDFGFRVERDQAQN